jgi:hypothetical protein
MEKEENSVPMFEDGGSNGGQVGDSVEGLRQLTEGDAQ